MSTPSFISPQGIHVYPGKLVIPGVAVIQELSISNYSRFLKFWEVGAALAIANPSSSFCSLWTHIESFRSSVSYSLKVLGIENPGDLTPSILEELLLYCPLEDGDIRGLVFRLHQDSLDPKFLGTLGSQT